MGNNIVSRHKNVVRSFVAAVLACSVLGAVTPAFAASTDPTSTTYTTTGKSVATLAKANIGKMACSTNSLGGTGFYSSCTGNAGLPEYWCADFARWSWAKNGVTHTGSLNALAGSFLTYARTYSGMTRDPQVGYAALFSHIYHSTMGGYSSGEIDHVAIVKVANADGTVDVINGDFGGSGSSEAAFAGSSHVVDSGLFTAQFTSKIAAEGYYLVGFAKYSITT